MEKPRNKCLPFSLLTLFSLTFIAAVVMALVYTFVSQSALPKEKSPIETVTCQRRPEVCTMECIDPPPYICGSNGRFYCSPCQACSDPEVAWYTMQNTLCSSPLTYGFILHTPVNHFAGRLKEDATQPLEPLDEAED